MRLMRRCLVNSIGALMLVASCNGESGNSHQRSSQTKVQAGDTELASRVTTPTAKKCNIKVPNPPVGQAKASLTSNSNSNSESKETMIQICAAINAACQEKCNQVFPKSYNWIENYICIASCETAAGTCILTAQNCL